MVMAGATRTRSSLLPSRWNSRARRSWVLTEGLPGADAALVGVLVPRQLRMAGMTGDVPYYGGRFTPRAGVRSGAPAGSTGSGGRVGRVGRVATGPGAGAAAPA